MNNRIPNHIAFIMDGNRRWARQKRLPVSIGHYKGYRKIEPTIERAVKCGIKHVTFWAFSTENWNRDKKEVDAIMKIFRELFKGPVMKRLLKKGVKLVVLGELDKFPEDIIEKVKQTMLDSKDNKVITVNMGLNYGGRHEILRAVRKIVKEKKENITEEDFSEYLYTKGQPDPDLIVRTGGEQRLSGFLAWQGVYSELYFTEKYWPDFDEKEFDKALEEYADRERRFGK